MGLKLKKKVKNNMKKHNKDKVLLNRDLDNLYKLSRELSSASSNLKTKSELFSKASMYKNKMHDLTSRALKRMVDELELINITTINLNKISKSLNEIVRSNSNAIIDARDLHFINDNEQYND